jgi:hypothetical protein
VGEINGLLQTSGACGEREDKEINSEEARTEPVMRKAKTIPKTQLVKFTGYGPDWWNYPPEWDAQTKKMLERDEIKLKNEHEKEI